MIFYNTKELTARYLGNKEITAVYKGARLIWEAVKSCFGKGFWYKEKLWNNKDLWKNN